GLGQDRAAQPGALQGGAYCEHAEVTGAFVLGDVGAAVQPVVAGGQEDAAAGPGDVCQQDLGDDAVAVQQVGLGSPAGATGLAAVGGGDQLDDCGDIGCGSGAEGGRRHGVGWASGRATKIATDVAPTGAAGGLSQLPR